MQQVIESPSQLAIINKSVYVMVYSILQKKVNVLHCYYSIITIVNIAYYNVITEVL